MKFIPSRVFSPCKCDMCDNHSKVKQYPVNDDTEWLCDKCAEKLPLIESLESLKHDNNGRDDYYFGYNGAIDDAIEKVREL